MFGGALEHSHNHTTARDTKIIPEGRRATSHEHTRLQRWGPQVAIPRGVLTVVGTGGGKEDHFLCHFNVDDALKVAVRFTPDGDRCLKVSASLASDHFQLMGSCLPTQPPLLAREKISHWDTKLEVLGWEEDIATFSIGLPVIKRNDLRDFLYTWPVTKTAATAKVLQRLIGKLLHVSQVVRPENVFVRRMLISARLPPVSE